MVCGVEQCIATWSSKTCEKWRREERYEREKMKEGEEAGVVE
jgi:hypothetical protein